MTTVAYRDGVLAADSRATNNGWVENDREVKVRKLADGRLIGLLGECIEIDPFLDWLTGGEKGPQPEMPNARVIVVGRNGARRIFEKKGFYREAGFLMAWGTGMPAAMGAMHAGAEAVGAIRAACKVDTHSGGRIRWVVLSGRSRLKRPRR